MKRTINDEIQAALKITTAKWESELYNTPSNLKSEKLSGVAGLMETLYEQNRSESKLELCRGLPEYPNFIQMLEDVH